MICLPTYAQQTVFNVPSADVTREGAIFIQHESQFRPWAPDAFWLGTHYSALGIGHNTELDATLFNVDAPSSHNIALGLGFKSAIPFAKEKYSEREFKLTVGSEFLISLDGNGVGNWSYTHLSGRVPKLDTRLTAGVSFGTKQVFGRNSLCFIAAVEQPVTKKIKIVADWYSGDQQYMGYLITGFSYQFPKDTALYVGYQIPNSSKVGKSGFVVEISKIIDLKKNKKNPAHSAHIHSKSN